jgi:predicted ester cyclase
MSALRSDVERNKLIIRQHVEAHNRQDAVAAASFFATGGSNHGRIGGPEKMVRIYQSLYATFPDFHYEVQALFGEGNLITAKMVMTGTHLGAPELPTFGGLLHGKLPTGKFVSVQNIHIYELRDDLIAEHWAVRDDLGMMQQLGLLPATNHPAGDLSRAEAVPKPKPMSKEKRRRIKEMR